MSRGSPPVIWGPGYSIALQGEIRDKDGNVIAQSGGSSFSGRGTADFNPLATAAVHTLWDDFMQESGNTVGQGEFSWRFLGTGTGATNTRFDPGTGESEHPGQYQFKPGSSAANYAGYVSNYEAFRSGECSLTFLAMVYLGAVPDVTDDYVFRFGMANTYPSIQHGFGLLIDRTIDTTNWRLEGINSSTQTTVDTGIAFAAGWNSLRLEMNAGWTSLDAYVNGTQSAAPVTTNLPTADAVGPRIIATNVDGTQPTHRIDLAYLEYAVSTARGTY